MSVSSTFSPGPATHFLWGIPFSPWLVAPRSRSPVQTQILGSRDCISPCLPGHTSAWPSWKPKTQHAHWTHHLCPGATYPQWVWWFMSLSRIRQAVSKPEPRGHCDASVSIMSHVQMLPNQLLHLIPLGILPLTLSVQLTRHTLGPRCPQSCEWPLLLA